MFERFTERARRVLFFGRYEASQLGSPSIETEHLLLGLVREGKGLTSRLFARAHVSLASIRNDVESQVVFRDKISTSVEIPFSAETKRVLQYAAEEADRLLHDYIGTEHLLLALLREERCAAAKILAGHGFRLETVRRDVEELLSQEGATPGEPAGTAPPPHARTGSESPRAPDNFHLHVNYVPSDVVHFSYSRRFRDEPVWLAGPRHWSIAGAELKSVIARAYGLEERHLTMPVELIDGTRYDVALVLPRDEESSVIEAIVQRAIEAQFHISVTREPGPGGEIGVVRRTVAGT